MQSMFDSKLDRTRFVTLKRRHAILAHFISEMKRETFNERFLVFLSFCCDDFDLVIQYIYPKLNETLKRISGINRERVCVGDRHFRPEMII